VAEVLTLRALNRATLARQLLLERSALSVPEAVAHLGGLQAQTTTSWYAGLWTRIRDFTPQQVVDLMVDRKLVRIAVMRSTIHLVTDDDCLLLRPLTQPVSERMFAGNWGKRLPGVDLAEVVEEGRRILEEEPLTFAKLGERLAEKWPDRDGPSMAQAVRVYAALVQPPPRGLWGRSGLAVHTTAEQWLGRPLEANASLETLVLRYLAAFGPATPNDAGTWSGLTRLGEVFERMRPRLVSFEDEQGRELFDLPDAPRPGADAAAPVRFLYDFDNLLLSHADRSRVLDPARRKLLQPTMNLVLGPILVDGFVEAAWRADVTKKAARLTITYANRPTRKTVGEVEREGRKLLQFLAPEVGLHEVVTGE
jgi:winged helix DNA-binding protein